MVSSNSSLPSRYSASSGFTLIELMVTIAVMAIIVSIAAPNVSSQLANQRVKSTTATLHTALREAKTESIIRRKAITVEVNNKGTNAGTIKLIDVALDPQGLKPIGTYTYDAKSTITGKDGDNKAKDNSVFSTDKTADAKVTYTICDSNTSASPRQIEVSKLAAINIKLGGTC